jgi:hypothetical protein
LRSLALKGRRSEPWTTIYQDVVAATVFGHGHRPPAISGLPWSAPLQGLASRTA